MNVRIKILSDGFRDTGDKRFALLKVGDELEINNYVEGGEGYYAYTLFERKDWNIWVGKGVEVNREDFEVIP